MMLQTRRRRPQNELEERHEVTRRDLTEQLEREVKKVYGKWDFQHSPPRKAATPKRSDCMAYTPKSALVTGVPKAKFASEEAAKAFFLYTSCCLDGRALGRPWPGCRFGRTGAILSRCPCPGESPMCGRPASVPPRMLSPPSMRSGGTPPASRR